ncbi:hypothetical protein K457DRAFT_141703, partial [Linnemannia elongata AG-77]
ILSLLCLSLFPIPSLTYPLPLFPPPRPFTSLLFPSTFPLSLIRLPLSFHSTLSTSTLSILVLF